MKELIIEEWEGGREYMGKLYKVTIEDISSQLNKPELLEMDEVEFKTWVQEENIDLAQFSQDVISVKRVEENLDSTNIYWFDADSNDSWSRIQWKGFEVSEPHNMGEVTDKDKNMKLSIFEAVLLGKEIAIESDE